MPNGRFDEGNVENCHSARIFGLSYTIVSQDVRRLGYIVHLDFNEVPQKQGIIPTCWPLRVNEVVRCVSLSLSELWGKYRDHPSAANMIEQA